MSQTAKRFVFGFQVKVTAVAVLSLLLVTALSHVFIYSFSVDAQFQQLRQQLIVTVRTASLLVDAQKLMRIPLNHTGIQSPDYHEIAAKFNKIREMNASIKHIYIFRKTDKPDIWQFVVDLGAEVKRAGEKELATYPGNTYMPGRSPEMMRGFTESSVDKELMRDERGVTLSAYAPIRDSNGTAIALMGIDMDARDVYMAREKIQRAALWVLLSGLLFSTALGVLLSHRMTVRINKLIEGTRHLSAGELNYHVEVKGHDELEELSNSFNQMAIALLASRKELEEYFFRVVQSLAHMLEAKDKHTKGHSERVGAYAQRIALKMGLPKEQADMLWRAGELHDIGKLAVHEQILNKEGPLTADEWEIIRQHPLIGTVALKPMCFNEIIMTSIYMHHERYDGTGYPQKLSGNDISVFAHIIAGADAFDAMTTTRPYRKAMDKTAAIKELKNNSGTQFHPEVITAFLGILEEDE